MRRLFRRHLEHARHREEERTEEDAGAARDHGVAVHFPAGADEDLAGDRELARQADLPSPDRLVATGRDRMKRARMNGIRDPVIPGGGTEANQPELVKEPHGQRRMGRREDAEVGEDEGAIDRQGGAAREVQRIGQDPRGRFPRHMGERSPAADHQVVAGGGDLGAPVFPPSRPARIFSPQR